MNGARLNYSAVLADHALPMQECVQSRMSCVYSAKPKSVIWLSVGSSRLRRFRGCCGFRVPGTLDQEKLFPVFVQLFSHRFIFYRTFRVT